MHERPNDTFQRAPKRKPLRGKHVVVSGDTKAAYEALIREKEARELRDRHLPSDMQRR